MKEKASADPLSKYLTRKQKNQMEVSMVCHPIISNHITLNSSYHTIPSTSHHRFTLFPTSNPPTHLHFHFFLFLFLSDCFQTKQHTLIRSSCPNEMCLDMSPQIVLSGKLRAAIRTLKARRFLLRHSLHFRRRRRHWKLRWPRLDRWLVVVGVHGQRTSLRWRHGAGRV